jgi:DHA1 family tetracycline resistance protein-like MFS transporter
MLPHRTPALGFILITLTLDILGIGLIVPILPELVKQRSHCLVEMQLVHVV